jgi:UDP-GlcNAc:undecaprenyl-phosphate GlcNAc-1-phosphate transferase
VLLVPVVRWVGFRTGRVSQPREDRWHRKPTPTLGGVGVFVAFALTLGVIQVATGRPGGHWGLLVAAAIMFGMGLYDDFKRISPPAKLIVQLATATLFIFPGDMIRFFPWPVANILLTVFWLVGITNAINLLDNMDGLAGGVALIAAGLLSYFNWRMGDLPLLIISLALTGGLLGFLVFNFPPARIFMGDSGSMFFGFTLAALAVARKSQASSVLAVMGVPTMLFLLPILDTTLVTVTRLLRGQSPAQGGTDHTSHRLVAFGLSERQAVLVLYGVAILSGLASIILEARDYSRSLILVPVVLIALSLFVAYLGRLKVVTTYTPIQTGVARLVANLTYKRRLFEIALDMLVIGVSYYLAYWTRFGLDMTVESMSLFLRSWPAALGAAYLSFFVFGVYRSPWRYVGVVDWARYFGAAVSASLLCWLVLRVVDQGQRYPLEILFLYAVFLSLGVGASRTSFQVLDRLFNRQQQNNIAQGVLIYGVGDAGEIALNWILRTPQLGYRPLGFLDDDPHLWGSTIQGVDVLGGMDRLAGYLEDHPVSGVLITSPTTADLPGLVTLCRARGVWVRQLKLEFELVE